MTQAALVRYRVLAYVVGVLLLVLLLVAMPLKHAGGVEIATEIVAPIHGVAYMVYLVMAFDLATKAKWRFGRTVVVLLGGAIPGLSFFLQRRVTGWVKAEGDVPPSVRGAAYAGPGAPRRDTI